MPLDLETMHLPPMVCTTASRGNNGDRVALLAIGTSWDVTMSLPSSFTRST